MSSEFEPQSKQVEQLEYKIHDLMDKPQSSAARHLVQEVYGLKEDLHEGKNKFHIDDRIKRIIHILEGEAKHEQIMNYEHLDMFKHWFEHLRLHFR